PAGRAARLMEVLSGYPLDALNTLRLSARAQWFAAPCTEAELIALLRDPRWQGLPRTVIGGGSNLVLAGDIEGLVVQPQLRGMQLRSPDGLVEVRAGEEWDAVVAWTLAAGLQGLENLSLIPGSCGAAPVQNIGAYGVELRDHLVSLDAV